MLDKKTLRMLYCALALCLVLRIGYTIYDRDADTPREARAYVRIGDYIADGKGFAIDQSFGDSAPTNGYHLTAYRAPVYPAFLGLIFATVGEGAIQWGVVQSIVDTVTCFLIFLYALHLLKRPKSALAAAAIYALYPPAIGNVAAPMPETVAALIALVACYFLIQAMGDEPKAYVRPGLALGILILTKPVMMLFPLAVVLMLLVSRRRIKNWLAPAAVYACAALVVVSCWTIRNYRVFHTLIPVSAQAGNALWGGTGPADGICLPAWSFPVESVGARKIATIKATFVRPATYMKIVDMQDRVSQMDEPGIDGTLLTEAADEIAQDPGRYFGLVPKKLVRMWFGLWGDGKTGFWTWLTAGINALMFVFAVLGYKLRKQDYRLRLVSLYSCAYLSMTSVLIYCDFRSSYPLIPLIVILASAYLGRMLDGGTARGRIVINV